MFDLSSTVATPGAAAIETCFAELGALGVRTVVFTNRSRREALSAVHEAKIAPDLILTRDDVGKPKGSPIWVEHVCRELDVEAREVMVVGAEQYAMVTASHAKTVFVNAGWGLPGVGYGIPLRQPDHLPIFVREFFRKDRPWYWNLTGTDPSARPVEARALLQGRGSYVPGLGADMMDSIHRGRQIRMGPFDFMDFVMYHTLGSLYEEGLVQNADLWTVYPGHAGGVNEPTVDVLDVAAKLVRGGFREDLLLRHTPAGDASLRRYNGERVEFADQVESVIVNPKYAGQVVGKRVLVFDDFTTDGYSFDWARNLLLAAGASRVVGVFIGAYRTSQEYRSPNLAFDPYDTRLRSEGLTFTGTTVAGVVDQAALTAFAESYNRVKAIS